MKNSNYYVIGISIIIALLFYMWLLSNRGLLIYAVDKLGIALILAFIVLLLLSSIFLHYGKIEAANELSGYAFLMLIIGAIAKIAAARMGR